MDTFLALVGMLISVLLIGIILLQRGRGGGLVGALSGLGGQSAFGTKAGDTFTRITIGIAAAWVLLAGIHGQVLRARTVKFKGSDTKQFDVLSKDKQGDASSKKSGLGTSSSDADDTESTPTKSKEKAKDKSDDTPSEEKSSDSKPEDKSSNSEAKPDKPAKKEGNESADSKPSDQSKELK